MATFRWQSSGESAKPRWGSTNSQRALDRRIVAYQARFIRVGITYPSAIDDDLNRMREALDEGGVRKLIQDGERAIAIIERGVKGGEELMRHLNTEITSGRLNPQDERAHTAAIDAFHRSRAREREETARHEREAQFTREEPIRRAREIDSLQFRIGRLSTPIAGPLRQQLAAVPINGKPRDYRRAVHALEMAIAQAQR